MSPSQGTGTERTCLGELCKGWRSGVCLSNSLFSPLVLPCAMPWGQPGHRSLCPGSAGPASVSV